MTGYTWGDLTREQLNAMPDSAVAVLPVGAVEQHGLHLPTKTDAFIAEHVAQAAVERTGDDVTAVLLPTVAVGSSAHHVPFGGTLSLRPETLGAVLLDIIESTQRAGFSRVVLVNGHGGNVEICGLAARRAAIERDMLVSAVSYWMTLDDEVDVPGHAGRFETSIMMHLSPGLVDQARARRSGASLMPAPYAGVVIEDPRQWAAMGGWTDDPTRADAGWGKELVDTAAARVGSIITDIALAPRHGTGAAVGDGV